MKHSNPEEVIKTAKSLPASPITAIKILDLMKTPDCSAKTVASKK